MKKYILAFLLLLTGCTAPLEEESIGIIGGADGPTAIMVATRLLQPLEIAVYVLVIAALIGLAVWLILRRRRK